MMPLVLEVEFLAGVSFAAKGPDSGEPDWPPQPDRVFSAFVATWAARGHDPQESIALEWLERLPAPWIAAADACSRSSPIVFVPPNDPRSDKKKHAAGVLPGLRSRQPRRFPAARPDNPVVRLLWSDAEPEEETFSALDRLARDTAYVGHSASLTRCRFVRETDVPDPDDMRLPERVPYAGRFAELRRSYDSLRRPLPGARVGQPPEVGRERTNLFGDQWLILEHVGGAMPDLRACALVARTLRDALLSGYRQIGLGGEVPEIVSGHAADGRPTRAHHLAIIPLPFAGYPHADGHVMGFALVPPAGSGILDDDAFRKALRRLASLDGDLGRRVMQLTSGDGTPPKKAFSIDLSLTLEPPAGVRSLDPALYRGPATTFATVTPIALDRHLKEKGAARLDEMAAQIAGACRNIGLPPPKTVVADKHSALEGVPSAWPSGGSPAWMRWRVPPSLASRQLTHAVIQFAESVDGPVILGAGRFTGLGLCRPLDAKGG